MSIAPSRAARESLPSFADCVMGDEEDVEDHLGASPPLHIKLMVPVTVAPERQPTPKPLVNHPQSRLHCRHSGADP